MDLKSINVDVSSFVAQHTDSEGDEYGTVSVTIADNTHVMRAVRYSEALAGCLTVLGFMAGTFGAAGLFVEENGNIPGFMDEDGCVVPPHRVKLADPIV